MQNKSFTLVELVCVIIVVGAISGLAITSTFRAVRIQREKDAAFRLQALMGLLKIHLAKKGSFPVGTYSDYSSIQTLIKTDFPEDPFDFSCIVSGTTGTNTTIECFVSYPPNLPVEDWVSLGRWSLHFQTTQIRAGRPVGRVYCDNGPCIVCTSTGCN